MTNMPDTQMIGPRRDILHPVLPAVRRLSFCLAVCAAPALAQATPEGGLPAGEAETIRQTGDGLLRAKRAYRTAHEADLAEVRQAVAALYNDLAALNTANAAARIEMVPPTAGISASAAAPLTLTAADLSAATGSSAPVAPARDDPLSVADPVGAGVAMTPAGALAAAAPDVSPKRIAAAAEMARLAGLRERAARVADLARRFTPNPTPVRSALAAQGAGAAPFAAQIAPQAVQRLVQIESEIEAALALAEPERRARLAALAESLRLRKPADLADAPGGPDSRQGMATRGEHRQPAQ